eukprot:TRINITY_DN73331_c0_g1_i1.p1 TRINITY_DN73331_c0_g1~~TRINITY_DN73331_c0_g1_i1.p1  ORF type:complete len:364 (-),score=41.97 TRINITY_DN73331_c0_g1_i1:15-1061(-)
MEVNAATDQRTELRERWNAWVDSRNAVAPSGAGQILVISSTWASMDLESQVLSSTIGAFALSIVSCLVAVVLFTQNIIVAMFVTINILLVVCLIAGTILNILAYEFGAIEAMGATIFVGLGVDYCLHLAHGYHEAPGDTPKAKMMHALVILGPSIAGGALTTIAGCAFLLPCRMILFRKLGAFLLSNAVYSVIYTFVFLTPILFICGPVGVAGTIYCFPCLRRFAPARKSMVGAESLMPVLPQETPDVDSSDALPETDIHRADTIEERNRRREAQEADVGCASTPSIHFSLPGSVPLQDAQSVPSRDALPENAEEGNIQKVDSIEEVSRHQQRSERPVGQASSLSLLD